MERKNKQVFWEALIIAIFIFGSGLFFGYFIELNQVSNVISLYQETELNLLDTKIQDGIISLNEIDCELFFNESVNFANRIYEEAKLLEKYEDSSQLSQGALFQHKKYDLLRANLWINTIKLKERCDLDFITLVYFYDYRTSSLGLRSEQEVFSRKLLEVRNEKGDKVILIPIASNLNINSIEYLKSYYKMDTVPTILINEKDKITGINELNNLDNYVN